MPIITILHAGRVAKRRIAETIPEVQEASVERLKHLCCVSPKLLAWQEQLQSFLFPAYRSLSLSLSHYLPLACSLSRARARVLSLSRSPSLALPHTVATMYTRMDMICVGYIIAKQAVSFILSILRPQRDSERARAPERERASESVCVCVRERVCVRE